MISGIIVHDGEEWRPITSTDIGMPVYVRSNDFWMHNKIKKKSTSDYNSLYFQNQLQSLNNRHGFANSMVSKFKPLNYELPLEGGSLTYKIAKGKVFVTEIKMDSRHLYQEKRKAAGLYNVNNEDEKWEFGSTKVKTVSRNNVAINGYCDSIAQAIKFLPPLIERGYKPKTTAAAPATSVANHHSGSHKLKHKSTLLNSVSAQFLLILTSFTPFYLSHLKPTYLSNNHHPES